MLRGAPFSAAADAQCLENEYDLKPAQKQTTQEELAEDMARAFLSENLPEDVFGAPKAGPGMWASVIRIINPVNGKTLDKIQLEQNEAAYRFVWLYPLFCRSVGRYIYRCKADLNGRVPLDFLDSISSCYSVGTLYNFFRRSPKLVCERINCVFGVYVEICITVWYPFYA